MKLTGRLRLLYHLVLTQKMIRMLLRSLWISGAVYIICWGVNAFSGKMSSIDLWIVISAFSGLFVLLTVLYKPVPFSDFLWQVDRKLMLKEQISTAHQNFESNKRSMSQANELDIALLDETAALVPDLIRNVLKKGWRLRNDLEASVVVFLLLVVVNLANLQLFGSALPGSDLGLLPALGSSPGFLDVFPSGIPGESPAAKTVSIEAEPAFHKSLQDYTPEEIEQIVEALKVVGEGLVDNTTTARFGRALVNGNFPEAAKQLDILSENIDRLSQETRLNIVDQFQELTRALYLSQFDPITEKFNFAAEALVDGDPDQVNLTLGEVSQLLRTNFPQAVADQEPPSDEDAQLSRLAGEGDGAIAEDPEDISGLLAVPGGGSADSAEILSGEVDLQGLNYSVNEGAALPTYSYSWKNHDVVSSYFQPR